MRWILLLLLMPTASALRIAASPDRILLDQHGTGVVQLINPNDETIVYHVDGEEGELGAGERVKVSGKFNGDMLYVKYRGANGIRNILLEPQLAIPIIRMNKEGGITVFWIVFILLVLIGLLVIYKLL